VSMDVFEYFNLKFACGKLTELPEIVHSSSMR
jgi:hypothetical protein